MISLEIINTKNFMTKLFKEEAFDSFAMVSLEIMSFASFEIKQKQETVLWKELRPFAFQIIKSGTTPKFIKLVFSLTKEASEAIKADTNFFLNIYYTSGEDGQLVATTGTSMKTFSLDKSGDHFWEDEVKKFFREHQLDYHDE